MTKNKLCILTGLAVLALDQLTKILAKTYFAAGDVALLPFFNFVLVWNRGVSFGLFSGDADIARYILSAMSLVIVAVLFFWLRRIDHKPLYIALAAVIAGALGNVIDRLIYGAVIDFLDFHIGGWHYPAFNVADSAIVLGIAFVVFDGLFLEPKRKEPTQKDATS